MNLKNKKMLSLKKIYKLFKLFRFRLWRKGLLNGIAATVELQNMVKDINFETIIDVGSNKGQFIILIEQLFPNTNIYSFEPQTQVLEKQKNFFNYKKNIFFYNFALGSTSSIKKLFITRRKDSSSFFKINENENENKSKYYRINNEENTQIKSLDEVLIGQEIIKPILMKIDVQGYELEVLKGSENMLKKIEYVLVEVSENQMYKGQPLANEVIKFLQDRNYQILKKNLPEMIDKTNFIQRDLLFQNRLGL